MPDGYNQFSLANHPPFSKAVTPQLPALIAVPRTLLLWLTVGVAGAVLFTAVYLIEGVTRPGYNAWQQAISALSLGPGGWIQQLNFVVYGVCTLCMAVALRKVLKGSAGAIAYPLIRGIEGLVSILVGLFSQDPALGYPPGTTRISTLTLHGEIHLIGAFVLVGALVLGFFVMAWRFARDLHWWGWAVYSVLSAVVTFFFIALFGMAQRSGGAAGLFERLATSTETIWGVLLLIGLWSGTKFMKHPR